MNDNALDQAHIDRLIEVGFDDRTHLYVGCRCLDMGCRRRYNEAKTRLRQGPDPKDPFDTRYTRYTREEKP